VGEFIAEIVSPSEVEDRQLGAIAKDNHGGDAVAILQQPDDRLVAF
jgi:hypothetical protein